MKIVFALATLALVLLIAPLLTAAPAEPTATPRVDVLVVEHTPEGAVERTGYVSAWRYTGTSMVLDFVDDGDELYHNGFDSPQ